MSTMWTFGLTFVTLMTIASADILVLPVQGRFIEAEMYDEPATFGNGVPYDGLHAMLIYPDPPQACGPLPQAPNYTHNAYHRWVLLVARFNCTFEEKVRNAQAAHYDGVIVHNVGSDALERMSASNSSGIHIPSVFIGARDGLMLADIYANNPDYFVIINTEARVNWNNLLIPFLFVIGICFLVMVIFMIIKYVRDRRRQRRERLSSSALNKIPIHKFQKGDPYETCAICLDDYVDGEKLRVLPCAHAYHSKCIDPWLTKNRRVCPVCKRRVFAQDETPYTDSENETDTDDTTPLLTNAPRGTQGGTFANRQTRLFGLLGQAPAAASSEGTENLAADRHSINGEYSSLRFEEYTSSSSSDSTEYDSPEEPIATSPSTSKSPKKTNPAKPKSDDDDDDDNPREVIA